MVTLFIISPAFKEDHLEHLEEWAQGLIGNEVPENEDYIAEKIIQFQVVREDEGSYPWRLAVLIAVAVNEAN